MVLPVADHSKNVAASKKIAIGITDDKREPTKERTYADIVRKPNDDVRRGRKWVDESEKGMTQQNMNFSKK